MSPRLRAAGARLGAARETAGRVPGGAGAGAGAPAFPFRAAWSHLIRQRWLWLVLGAWLAQAVGFGVALNHAMLASLKAAGQLGAAEAADMRAQLLPGSLDTFAAGSLCFFGAAMALAIGAMALGGEYRSGTARLLYTQGPSRRAVAGAQLTAVAGMLGVMTALTYAVDYAGLALAAAIAGWPVEAPPLGATVVSVLASWLMALAYGLVGACLAVLTRGPLGALAAGLVWTLGAETVLIALANNVSWLNGPAHALLGAAASNLAVAQGAYPWWFNRFSETVDTAGGWLAAGVLAAWAAASAAVAIAAVKHRDIEA
ncbi:MAG: ABC transporter permease [Bifidobacteriaceae bacterium]|jgi:ABC-type transport system involved in multi-copper enzyme maturation permease subunit|nr:ABC transporter permease [Bifidobacteriaceae bacterium]